MLDGMMDDTDLVSTHPFPNGAIPPLPPLQPTQEVLEKVFEFRKLCLQRLCFE